MSVLPTLTSQSFRNILMSRSKFIVSKNQNHGKSFLGVQKLVDPVFGSSHLLYLVGLAQDQGHFYF